MVDKAYYVSPAGQAYTIEIAKLISYMAMGFYFYDLILNFPFDWSIITGKRQRRWPQLAYFTARLSLLIYIALLLQVLWGETSFACQTVFYVIEFFMGIIVWTSSILLACRSICVYSGATRDIVATTLSIMALGLLAAWMQDVMAVTAMWSPENAHPWSEGACVWLSVSKTYFVKYVCTIIFDATVLVATVFGILRMNGKSRLGSVLIRQGVIYFAMTLAANLAITVLTLLQLSPTVSLMAAVPQSVVCVLCASRLYVQLANEARPQNVSSHYSSSHMTSGGGHQSSSIDDKDISSLSSPDARPQRPPFGTRLSSAWAKVNTLAHGADARNEGIDSRGTVPSYFSSSPKRNGDIFIDAQGETKQSPPTLFTHPFPFAAARDLEKQDDEASEPVGVSPGSPYNRAQMLQGDGIHILQEQVIQFDSNRVSPPLPQPARYHPYSNSSHDSDFQMRFPKSLGSKHEA